MLRAQIFFIGLGFSLAIRLSLCLCSSARYSATDATPNCQTAFLKALSRVCQGTTMGGDTRSLDYSSYVALSEAVYYYAIAPPAQHKWQQTTPKVYLRFPKIRGTILGVPIITDYSILGVYIGVPLFKESTISGRSI